MRRDASPPRHPQDAGFTLIELLVVVTIIAVLAAIALPMFLSQDQKGRDAVAKSDARTLVSLVEACHAGMSDYTLCDTEAEVGDSALDWGSGAGQVDVVASAAATYTIVATSRTTGAGTPHVFTVSRLAGGLLLRTCTTGAPGNHGGGCADGSW